MRHRRWIVALVVLALAAMVVVCILPTAGPTRANAERIKKGITQAEVEAILGPPTSERWSPDDPDESRATWWTVAAWEPSDGYVIVVYYGGFVDDLRADFEPPFWERIARRVGLGP